MDRIFANRETMTLDTTLCATGTTYTPNSSDGRKLVVYFKDETMAAYEAMPLMNLNYVPQSMYALEAQKVDKFEASHILRAVDGSGNPVAAPALNPTQLTNLSTLLATPAANYVQTTSNGSVALPVVAGNPTSGLAAGQIWYDSGSNVMKYYDGAVKTFGTSSGGVTSVTAGNGLTGGTITTSGTINVDVGVTTGKIVQVGASDKLPAIDGSNLTNITATDATKLPLAGGTMTGPLVNNSNSASTALAVTQTGAGYAATFMGGNVGIGTATPAGILDVQGSTSSSGAGLGLILNAQSAIQSGGTSYAGGGISMTAGNGYGSALGGNVSLTAGRGNYASGASGTGGSLTLNSSGAAGIGGAVSLAGGTGGNGFTGGDLILTGGAADPLAVAQNGAKVTIDGGAKAGTGNKGNVILQSTGGNVGIGTSSPGSKLEVTDVGGSMTFTSPAASAATLSLKNNTSVSSWSLSLSLV